ncbi:hypothetical protein BDZ97DRAFT_1912945 [Flammula alnicola]|nr:hypothetical protein BDZ97DRAFT_1912945 [Flammula alnicola]
MEMVGQNISNAAVDSRPIGTRCISHIVDLVIKGHTLQFALLPGVTTEMLPVLNQLWEELRMVGVNNGSNDKVISVLKQITDLISNLPVSATAVKRP